MNIQRRSIMGVVSTIRQYISHNLLYSDDGFPYLDDDSLLEKGIIDSMGVMEMVVFVEQEFGVSVPDRDITPENFDSVNKLAHYINTKMQEHSPMTHPS
jgi:acyl carrier protein